MKNIQGKKHLRFINKVHYVGKTFVVKNLPVCRMQAHMHFYYIIKYGST